MRQKITVYGLRFSKTTFWNCLNTGFLEPAVATALTARGIETSVRISFGAKSMVATALTARGIETSLYSRHRSIGNLVATALIACGIETRNIHYNHEQRHSLVATVFTAYSMYQLNSINPRVNHFDLLGGFVS